MAERRRFRLVHAKARELAEAAVREAPDGYHVEVKPPTRNLDQNALMWACLEDVSAQVDWYGVKLSADDWKDVLTASLRQCRVVPGIDTGTFVPLGMRTSEMTVPEMRDLIELIYAFGAGKDVKFRTDTDTVFRTDERPK